MTNALEYPNITEATDWQTTAENLDWKNNGPSAAMEAAAILNDTLAAEYLGIEDFQDHLTNRGFTESAATGAALQLLLEAVPPEYRTEVISCSLDLAKTENGDTILAHWRECIQTEGLNWSEPNQDNEQALANAVGEAAYRELATAREIFALSAYLCATPGNFGRNDRTHYLRAAGDAYEATLCQDGQTTEHTMEFLDLSFRRMAYVTRNHLESILDHTPPEYPEADDVKDIIERLNGQPQESGAQTLADTAQALWQAAATDGSMPEDRLESIRQLAAFARECAQSAAAKDLGQNSYQYLTMEESKERLAYEATDNLRTMGYRDEHEIVTDIASGNWHQVCQAITAMQDATGNHQMSGIVAMEVLNLAEQNPGKTPAMVRYFHHERTLSDLAQGNAYIESAADAMTAMQDAGAGESAAKLDRMLRCSMEVQLLRTAPSSWETYPNRSHQHYNDLAARTHDVVEDLDGIPENEDAHDRRAAMATNHMIYRLMSETKEILLQQYRADNLSGNRATASLTKKTQERINQFMNNEAETAQSIAEALPLADNVQRMAKLTARKLALEEHVLSKDEPAVNGILEQLENDWDDPALHAECLASLHPMIQEALNAAERAATQWTDEEVLDGAQGYQITHAETRYTETDGGRESWLRDTGRINSQEIYAGDCTIRALASATGRPDLYGHFWETVSKQMQETGASSPNADHGARPVDLVELQATHGIFQIYNDATLPPGFARDTMDLREVPVALGNLFNDDMPLTYMVGTNDHYVAVVKENLMDHADTRGIGEDDQKGTKGRVELLWIKCDDENILQQAKEAFNRYARVRAFFAA